MSWTQELYELYEQNHGTDDSENTLLPVAHSTVNAQVTVLLDEEGNFNSAYKIEDKKKQETVIPVTENSGARSSGIAPHPLTDKLIYIAGDYPIYVTGKHSDNTNYYDAYIEQITEWENSEFSHMSIKIVASYLRKKSLISDLVKFHVLEIDENTGKLKEKVKILGIAQEEVVVRFQILYKNSQLESRTWCDQSLYDSFIGFNNLHLGQKQLCYATGMELPCTYKHPSKIRNAGDKAKLISSNDESGFSYRGRFSSKEEAISVSYDFSQKIHNALKWIINRQGINIGSLSLVVWESSLQELPDILEDSDDLFGDEEDILKAIDTVVAYKHQLDKTIFGYKQAISEKSRAIVLGLDAATPGRISISIYSELSASDFLENVKNWHYNASWFHFNGRLKKNEMSSFALRKIAEAAYGTEQEQFISAKPEIINDTICRLIPCVIEGNRIPRDIVANVVRKACNPLAYDKNYNWRLVLEIACALIRKEMIEEKGDCIVSLDKNSTSRDYLYGRLLAIADAVENATYGPDEKRTTNAKRLFEAFSNRPYYTWGILHNKIMPYLTSNKLSNPLKIKYTKLLEEVMNQFSPEDMMDNSRLKPEFLHAYYCQLSEIYKKNNDIVSEEEE